MTRNQIIDALWHGNDPIKNFPRNLYLLDLQGWRSVHEYLLYTIDNIKPSIIVEIGVWKGGSTISMATRLKERSVEGVVISVDTWLGAVDHWLAANTFEDLSFENGFPSLYKKFINNVINSDVADYVVPLPLDSINASELLQAKDIKADLIHLDAGHEYKSVYSDLEAWWPRLRSGGVFVGDDYDPEGGSFPGVLKAFNDFFEQRDIRNFDYLGGKCLIRKE